MINSVRNTVLAIINKNNYGYISPSDFNLFAKQAQLDIFDEYFYNYNKQINEENARVSGTGYADIKLGYEEVIDTFSVTAQLTHYELCTHVLHNKILVINIFYLLNLPREMIIFYLTMFFVLLVVYIKEKQKRLVILKLKHLLILF